jgi:phospho-N-acetylmuramoyl-pentapeptide-transferase
MISYLMVFISFGLSFLAYPKFIAFLKDKQHNQSVSEYALDSFKSKEKTPVMGGVIFVLIPSILMLVFKPSVLSNPTFVLVFMSFIMYAFIGLWDDLKILYEKNNRGLSARFKLFLQIVFATIIYLLFREHLDTSIYFKPLDLSVELGHMYFILIVVMLSGASNAVNITDGMDGLAAGTVLIALLGFIVLMFSNSSTDLYFFTLSVMASLAAFLVFNQKPAKIFMGDVGSLALGALLASLAMVLKQELTLIFFGLVFIYETVCVMLQIFWVKVFKKRLFRYTPIHYSFILNNWRETAVVYLFYGLGIIGLILGLWVTL